MHPLGQELSSRLAASQRALEVDGAVPLDGTRQIIRRKRAQRHGVTTGIAVVAVGVLATVGVVALREPRDMLPEATLEPPVRAHVSINADWGDPTVPVSGFECGDAAPQAATEGRGYRLEIANDTPTAETLDAGYVTGRAEVTDANDQVETRFSLAPEIVVVQDGKVVSVQASRGLVNPASFAPGRKELMNDFTAGPWEGCDWEYDSDPHYGGPELAPGAYEFYVVSTVANSPEIAALAEAAASEGVHVIFDGDTSLEPSDWECAHELTRDEAVADISGYRLEAVPDAGSVAVACLPARVASATWSDQTRSFSLPYASEPAFKQQLVAGPFDFEVPKDSNWSLPEVEFTGTACGSEVPWDEDWPDTKTVTVHTRPFNDLLLAGSGTGEALVWPNFGNGGISAREFRVQVPDGGRAAIIEKREVVNDEGVAIDVRYIVVGHADVTVNGGHWIDVSRAEGPSSAEVDISDVSWCGDEPPAGLSTLAVSMTVYPDELVGGWENTPKLRFYPLG